MPPQKRKRKKSRKRKKTNYTKWFYIILSTILIALTVFLIIQFNKTNTQTIFYADLNISIPNKYSLFGIDVSTHQGKIQWEKVKAMQEKQVKLVFVLIKATEGNKSIDKRFKQNWQSARNEGFYTGAYHFFIATKSGKTQAENFIKNVDLNKNDLPPVVDIEELYGASKIEMQNQLDIFLSIIEKHYNVKPIIYSYASFYNQNLGNKYKGYPLWVAHYYKKDEPNVKRDWILWQQSEVARVYGIKTKVDFNIFNGDSIDFKDFLIQ